jgi:prefoldin subunit 5
MPIDPAELRWIQGLEANIGRLTVAAQRLSLKLESIEGKLKAIDTKVADVDSRIRGLKTFGSALFFAFLGSVGTHIYWAGSVDATVKAQARQVDEVRSATERVSKDLQEHERRASVPKTEQAR